METRTYQISGRKEDLDILTLTGAKVKDLEVIGNIYEREVNDEKI